MSTVLAAVDNSPAAGPVLAAARRLAGATGSSVRAVHVGEPGRPAPQELADRLAVELTVVDGTGREVEDVLLESFRAEGVRMGVVGARDVPGGARPVGHIAQRLVESSEVPVLVVPPDAPESAGRPPWRVLLPLEGDEETSRDLAGRLARLLPSDVELVVLHVATAATAPVVDHAEWGISLWAEEFLARYCPTASRVDLRSGDVGGRILEACADVEADLVVLSWSQDTSAGHAAVVRDVLAHTTIPVALIPVARRRDATSTATSASDAGAEG